MIAMHCDCYLLEQIFHTYFENLTLLHKCNKFLSGHYSPNYINRHYSPKHLTVQTDIYILRISHVSGTEITSNNSHPESANKRNHHIRRWSS